MQISAKEIAQMLDGTLEGDPEAIITHPGTGPFGFAKLCSGNDYP